MFDTILIANRGEIAVRIMRTARRMGLKCIGVYSDADEHAMHVAHADEAYRIGPAPVSESYLRADKIIKAARLSGAQAIHPGYGFLSENADFVEACTKAGLTFIGPPAPAIRAMGLKDAAKKLMHEAGVPIVPGYYGAEQDADFLAREADKIGYPVLIKARAGGGGKGMRLVHGREDFSAALTSARSEAAASFGDDHVLIESFIPAPRHIEVQVFGDTHGDVVHLYERDCSMQRRHQKVIEEAPAPGMNDAVRTAMCDAAIKAARAVGYVGAGTVEFIVNGAGDGNGQLQPDGFWFMEMNTRLQVEHPVSEAVTGQDLVEWQLRVAAGEPLPLRQEQIQLTGHAFEARLYAEDAAKDFMPAIGRLDHLHLPFDLARIDTGVQRGDEITPYYDPMIAKIITHAPTRQGALNKLSNALAQVRAQGCVTNAAFLQALSRHEEFAAGDVDTALIERNFAALTHIEPPGDELIAAAALAALGLLDSQKSDDPWKCLPGWALWQSEPTGITLEWRGQELPVTVMVRDRGALAGTITGALAGSMVTATAAATATETATGYGAGPFDVATPEGRISVSCLGRERDMYRLNLGGKIMRVMITRNAHNVCVVVAGTVWEFALVDSFQAGPDQASGDGRIIAPLPGLVKRVLVRADETVVADDLLVVIEAMKMEHSLRAPVDGKIEEVMIGEGDQVEEGAALLLLTPAIDETSDKAADKAADKATGEAAS